MEAEAILYWGDDAYPKPADMRILHSFKGIWAVSWSAGRVQVLEEKRWR